MKAGLEVHQQLATGKLFCACPSELSDDVWVSFVRRLRAASGESQEVDPAAAFQAARGLAYRYEAGPTSCLVDMDEEPPHAINPLALETTLVLSLLLHARPLDEIEVMRKIVVDGSNTTGFQRTALVAVDGHLTVHGKRISIPSVCLEEDAARKTGESGEELVYRLDRLGIPLVEIATGPEIESGAEAREVAEEIGALLRSTGRVRRGIGTIREDVNVSIEGGHRIEIKGVQELRKIEEYVRSEVERQELLLSVRDELARRKAPPVPAAAVELTELFGGVDSGPLSPKSRGTGPVLALPLQGFADLLRSPPEIEERLGRELAERARTAGLRGLLHSDELPGYGIDAPLVERVRSRLGLAGDDAFVLLTDRRRDRAEEAVRRVAERANQAREGIPGETRDPLPDGRTRFSRPLPGRDRMYPETDVPPVVVDPARIAELQGRLPERPSVRRDRLARQYGLSAEIARQLVAADEADRFEALADGRHPPALVARLLTQDLPGLVLPEGIASFEPTPESLDALLTAADQGRIAKEGIPRVLGALAAGAASLDAAIVASGLGGLSRADLEALVERVVDRNTTLLGSRGDGAFSPLMGELMQEVRGRRDGSEVADLLRAAIARRRGPG